MNRYFYFCLLCAFPVLLLLPNKIAAADSCNSATESCSEWVMPNGGQQKTLIYRNHSLQKSNKKIQRALIMIHGMGRNGNDYFRTALTAGFVASALDNSIIISPRFAASNGKDCKDELAANELNWQCNGSGSWRNGGVAENNQSVTSYDVIDAVLKALANKKHFPNLQTIVVTGHSAGGQFVGRYAMANTVHDSLGVSISYFVANPSSYTYLDSQRPTVSAYPRGIASQPPGYLAPLTAPMPEAFVEFSDNEACSGYDQWPYGLKNRDGYTAKIPDQQLKQQLAARAVTYLVGELDILPLYGFDNSCAAMAQGPTRLARGLAYAKHVNEKHAANHRAIMVHACGHSNRCVYTSDEVWPSIFPTTP